MGRCRIFTKLLLFSNCFGRNRAKTILLNYLFDLYNNYLIIKILVLQNQSIESFNLP